MKCVGCYVTGIQSNACDECDGSEDYGVERVWNLNVNVNDYIRKWMTRSVV